ncbi:MAG: HAD hydrolase-like protein [Clostridiales bacterium]|nr:HAD hydrolase-like protein [Clostridiales bacterium]
MKKLIIFDLDGTLLDTSRGIMHCYRKTSELLGLEKKQVKNETFVIGGPLRDGFLKLYNINSEEKLNNAVDTYRRLYSREGVKKFVAYEGIDRALQTLRERGYMLAVATLKLEEYAKKMLGEAEISGYFDLICGWDGTDRCTKAFILKRVLSELDTAASEALLAGDSVYDKKGAEAMGIDFLAVSYGFGFKDEIKSGALPLAAKKRSGNCRLHNQR